MTRPAALDSDELALLHPIPERRYPAHPHPLLLVGGDLVANALADDLTLELRKRQQNVQGQAAHRGCRVELLRDRNNDASLASKISTILTG